MKAFLSYSSKDAAFVADVAKVLGDSQCEFDQKTFEFTFNVQAIRSALRRCNLYVLFLSSDSISSTFVAEEQRAALEARGAGLIKQVLIFAIDATSYKSLPDWLREINVATTISSPKACARRIQTALLALAIEREDDGHIYIPRPEDENELRKVLSAPPGKAPTVLHVVGHHGVGRRTFLRKCLGNLYPRMDTSIEVTLSSFQGVDDFYRELYQLYKIASLEQAVSDFDNFSKMPPARKFDEIRDMIFEIAENEEFFTIVDDHGIYTEAGEYHDFVRSIFEQLGKLSKPVIGVVQTRMMPPSSRMKYEFSFHQLIRQFGERETRELLSFKLKQKGVEFTEEQLNQLASHLDGHPINVRFAVEFAAAYGLDLLLRDPSELVEYKWRRADDFLKRIEFTKTETDVIAALAHYRYLAADTLIGTISNDVSIVSRALRRLEDYCCVERRADYYHISSQIIEAVKRDKRFDRTSDWFASLTSAICDQIAEYKNEDHVPIAVLETAVIASAWKKEPPLVLSGLILPSHLLRIARQLYDDGKRVLCIEFCERAFSMKDRLTFDGRVEALRLWALSAIRIGDQAAADRLIGILQSYNTPLSKRVSLFLEGFRYRLLGRLDEAEDKLTAAWKMNRNNPSINRELASLYCKQKRYAEAEVFARASYVVAPTNPYLLDIMAETLLGKLSQGLPVDLGELNRIFAALKRYGDAPGSSFYLIREAQRLVRERNLLEARRVIDKAIERTPALLSAHFIKSEICLEQNDVRGAERCASELNRLLTDLGGFSEGDEARLAELQVRIEINKSQFRMAKAAIERKAFLTDAMQRRLLSLLAKSISFDPSKADKDLQDWARQYRE